MICSIAPPHLPHPSPLPATQKRKQTHIWRSHIRCIHVKKNPMSGCFIPAGQLINIVWNRSPSRQWLGIDTKLWRTHPYYLLSFREHLEPASQLFINTFRHPNHPVCGWNDSTMLISIDCDSDCDQDYDQDWNKSLHLCCDDSFTCLQFS